MAYCYANLQPDNLVLTASRIEHSQDINNVVFLPILVMGQDLKIQRINASLKIRACQAR